MGLGCFGLVAAVVAGHLPLTAALAPIPFGVVALWSRGVSPRVATMLLVRGAYLLFAVLFLAVAFRPLSSVPLPDVGILGPYTYLATEVAFGALAFVLLVRADALGRALRTTAVLYPLAYVWDWYTLEIGVFSIPLRTGVELLGIPLEEHLFMVIVPCLVVGVHEAIHGGD
jgi:lycopene cyclase domain-containing protein